MTLKVLVLVNLQVGRLQLEDYKNLMIESHFVGVDSVIGSKIALSIEGFGIVVVFVVWDL